jgi:ATP-binding protein involved in chromosome partitioning
MSVDDVIAALDTVKDPELGRSIVELGMVRDAFDESERLGATIVLTTPACPLRNRIRQEAEEALLPLADGRDIVIELDAMSPGQRRAMADSLEDRHQLVRTLFGPGSCTRTIAVTSGKGGVGKSTVSTNLAVGLAQLGHAVSLIDSDIYGPTIPLMLGLPIEQPPLHHGKVLPPTKHGVSAVSIGLFLPSNEPVVWRGPMLGRAVEQFLADVHWGSPDYLIIDLPPGTGDVALSIAQMMPAAEMIIVTTPQQAAAAVAVKAAKMARMTGHTILGVVENMAYFDCGACGSRHFLFGRGGGSAIAEAMDTALLASIPLTEEARQAGDSGRPSVLDGDSAVGEAFRELARRVDGVTPADADLS